MTSERPGSTANVQDSSTADPRAELAGPLKETDEELILQYYDKCCDLFEEFGIGFCHEPPPFEVIEGIAQAFADASGYKVVLQAAIMVPLKKEPNMLRILRRREVFSAEPNLFSTTVPEGGRTNSRASGDATDLRVVPSDPKKGDG